MIARLRYSKLRLLRQIGETPSRYVVYAWPHPIVIFTTFASLQLFRPLQTTAGVARHVAHLCELRGRLYPVAFGYPLLGTTHPSTMPSGGHFVGRLPTAGVANSEAPQEGFARCRSTCVTRYCGVHRFALSNVTASRAEARQSSVASA